ncbi:MAG: DUF2252 domain-containing protein [Acidobacteria bacterium]|nr:DUF2252 domain-containing protein [Acidobacteriota bacterium]
MKKKPSKTSPGPEVPSFTHHLSRDERLALGKGLRGACPRAAHAKRKAPAGRPDPVDLVLAAEEGRLPELLPLRHGRMVRSAFTFYRGAALHMATDLANTPNSGFRVQCGGDSHLCNFGAFATPERQVIFSINDLDETLPAPWEWDVKRLAASFVVGCRDNGLSEAAAREAALRCVRSYREHMAEFSTMRVLDLWYLALDSDTLITTLKDDRLRRRAIRRLEKERGKTIAEDVFPKLADAESRKPLIRDQRPTIFHWKGHTPGEIHQAVAETFARYRETLAPSCRVLLDRYEIKDAAIKVVGVGSVGTACWIVLLQAGEGDPLFLQVKEARASVLEAFAGPSVFPNHGQRVVNGQRLMQPASDIFLGWMEGPTGLHFYVRQLRDCKISFAVETFGKAEMYQYAMWCGWALALCHARGSDPAVITGYLGRGDAFDEAVADFSLAYADQNEKDYTALAKAVRSGRIEALIEEED